MDSSVFFDLLDSTIGKKRAEKGSSMETRESLENDAGKIVTSPNTLFPIL